MKNENNVLKLKRKTSLLVVKLKEGITVAIPVINKLSNAKVLDVFDDGSFTAHQINNWNEQGDFRTELMKFDNNLVLDEENAKERNAVRTANRLIPIKN